MSKNNRQERDPSFMMLLHQRRRPWLLFSFIGLALLTTTAAACDSSDFPGCKDGPNAGSQEEKCPKSVFPQEDNRAREVSGIVRRGSDPVEGAIVRVEPWFPELTTTKTSSVVSTVTNSVGFFGSLRPVGLRYDITTKLGGDVIVFRGVASRYIEPTLEIAERKFPPGWTSHINVTMDVPLRTDRTIAFFGNGDGIFGLVGDLATGLNVVTRDFTSKATVHAVEYVKGQGIDTATGYGRLDVMISPSAPALAVVHLDPITTFAEPSFTVNVPPGFPTPKSVDIILGFTPLNDAHVVTLPVGVKGRLPAIPNSGYLYRTRSVRADGAISDSGEVQFDAYVATSITLPAPPLSVLDSPVSTAATEPLVAIGDGVLEHVLTSDEQVGPAAPTAVAAGAVSRIQIVVKERDARLPDLVALGAPPLHGSYTWTVRSYPTLRFVEELSGQDARRHKSVGVSQPRTIIIR